MSIKRRVERLEGRYLVETGPEREKAWGEIVRRLTDRELEWLLEPSREAQSLVPCPHVEIVSCGCRNDARERRGFKARPDLLEESARRINALRERADEIMERAPQ